MGRFWETSSDCLTERQLRHEHRHRFWWKSGMIPIFLLNDCSSCQQFPLLCLFPFPRSSVTRERDEKRSARSWNLRVISRTQQAVKTDNRSSHSLSLSLSLSLAHAIAKSIEIQTQKGTLFRNTLLECMLIRTFTRRPEKINRLM